MITRTMLNSLAHVAMETLGETNELVTLTYQSVAGGSITTLSNLRVKLSQYAKREVAQNPVLQDARRCRIPWETLVDTTGAQVEPTRYCLITRADGSVWKVDSIEDGDHRPNWFLQLSRVS